jgi:hypothetical protein
MPDQQTALREQYLARSLYDLLKDDIRGEAKLTGSDSDLIYENVLRLMLFDIYSNNNSPLVVTEIMQEMFGIWMKARA